MARKRYSYWMLKQQEKVPSPLIRENKRRFFSVLAGSKTISIEDGFDKKGNPKFKYIPNTKVNRDEIDRIKGKPDVYGKRKIWW